ncbi:methyltransferase domain-containing protein [Rhizobium sp. WL3]|uniref:class I SAM-dependent methyltransferase n=1 Tax=Rhizobium sp. WL3 TaxID=2603277 RepID=UPI001FEE4B79|nr:methyltransferase domain-containing protein [Rhizobium sp. WL3]
MFDCTIGIGRFIGHLPRVTRYDGMDLSEEFVGFVREAHPDSEVVVGDLLAQLPLENGAYDNAVCLRSLSGIGSLHVILPEMIRVVRPGGLIVIDYGRRATVTNVKGIRTVLDGDDLDGIIATLDASVTERIYVDALLARVKAYNRVFRFINGPRGRLISDQRLIKMDRILTSWLWQRQIVVLRKNL